MSNTSINPVQRGDLPPGLDKLARECVVVCEGYKGVPRDRIAVSFFAGAMAIAPEKMDSSWAFTVALRGYRAIQDWTGLGPDDEPTG